MDTIEDGATYAVRVGSFGTTALAVYSLDADAWHVFTRNTVVPAARLEQVGFELIGYVGRAPAP